MKLMPSRALRYRLEAGAGIFLFALFFRWGWLEQREPFHTFYYLFAWGPFLWVVDRAIALRTGRSLLARPINALWLGALSTTFWLLFEVLNVRLQNWVYLGVPAERWLRWPGYALSFATVMPGVLMVRELIAPDSPPFVSPAQASPARGASAVGGWLLQLGILMIALPLLWPRSFFPLIWGGVLLMLDPWVARKGGYSLIRDWKAGAWRRTLTLLAAGLICGLFWEGCNDAAGAKWRYTLPSWTLTRLFEMPALGFIGFLPFALEAHAADQAARIFWRERTAPGRWLIILGVACFWMAAFAGIDRWTVKTWR
jgi:hypothetical protein